VHREIGHNRLEREPKVPAQRPRHRLQLASHRQACAWAATSAHLSPQLQEDGKVILTHGGTEIGQGCNTVFCQMAAETWASPLKT
jgi:CO/xanthine dehydrogenase Mo-binding subunit